jgi:hypothetical protein
MILDFASLRRKGDWPDEICRRFGNWLNARLTTPNTLMGAVEAAHWREVLDEGNAHDARSRWLTMSDISALILLPHLKVQNANAISGPLTWGFPSPTAFTGFVHALERKFAAELKEGFAGVGIVCHHFDPQVSQPPGRRTQVFRLTRNPVGKDGGTMALVEEGRAHMEVSLVIAVKDYKEKSKGEYFAEDLHHAAQGMRWPAAACCIRKASVIKRNGGRWPAMRKAMRRYSANCAVACCPVSHWCSATICWPAILVELPPNSSGKQRTGCLA